MALYICPTPIGNLEDITLRVINVLKDADFIAAEDTRRTGKLLKHLKITKRMLSYNDHNKEARTKIIIQELKRGVVFALVSDSGTPGISDPGFYLIRECIREGIEVLSLPGANAVVTALVGSGLPTDRFAFYGFLPKKEKKLRDIAENIKKEKLTFVFYESPHRIKKTLKIFAEEMPEKQMVIARELTKMHEEFIRGSAVEVYDATKGRDIKGEIVLLVS